MSVRWKLFTSYLVVIAIGAIVLIGTTISIAPVTFTEHIGSMRGVMNQSMSGSMMADLETELNDSFNSAMSNALFIATLAATSAAAIVSAYVSYRITSPIQAMVQASQRIASGYYDERLGVYSSDELGQLTQSFNRMAASLAEIETTRQHLIADISHELKTPLASIQGYMEGLQDGVIDPTQETFEQIHRETRRLKRLVYDLQELSRAEAGQMALQITKLNICELLQSASNWIKPQFDDKQVKLSTDLLDEPLHIQGDYDRLRQVILNLLGNALQYTPERGTVTIECERISSDILVRIQDTGIGLTHEDTQRIFERFYRVDKSRSRLSGGSGIGLTIARHIVQAHGGDLWAESPGINKGTIFHIKLPRNRETS